MKAFIIIEGEPQGKARPRFSRRSGAVYTPTKTMDYEKVIKNLCMVSNVRFSEEKVLVAEIVAYFAIPKSVSKKKHQAMLSGEIRPNKKPDLDNIAKVVLDSANGVLYSDDKQIVHLVVDKFYSENPRIELTVFEI